MSPSLPPDDASMTRARRWPGTHSAASFAIRLGDGASHATLLGVMDQVVVSLANFATTVAVGKLAGVTALGEYSLAFTILLLLMTLQDSLIASPYSVVCHQLRRGAQRRLAGNLLLIAAIFAVTCSLVLLATGQIVGEAERPGRFAAVAWTLALAVPTALIRELLRRMALAHLDVRAALGIDIVASVFQIGTLVVMASLASVTSYGALLSIAVGGLAGIVTGLIVRRREWRIHGPTLPRHLLRALAFGKWLVAARLTSTVHSYVVPWLLGMMIGLEVVGGFTAAFALIAVANPMLIGLLNVMAPQAARAWTTGGARAVEQVVMRGAIMLISVTMLLAVPIAIFAKDLLGALYGSQYRTYGDIGTVLAISLVATVVGIPADHGLRAVQRPAGSFLASCCGLTVTILGTLTLVPVVGLIGGACALSLGSTTSAAGRWLTFRRLVHVGSDPSLRRARAERIAEV